MIPPEVLQRAPINIPEKSTWSWVRSLLLNAARPRIGGVDIWDADEIGVALPMAIVYFATIVTVFFSFIVTLTTRQVETVYFSPRMDEAGTICNTVPITITNRFFASYDGLWNTNVDYDPSKLFLLVDMLGFQADAAKFQFGLDVFGEDMRIQISRIGQNRTTIYSLLALYYYGSWIGSDDRFKSVSPLNTGLAFKGALSLVSISSSDGKFCEPLHAESLLIGGFDGSATAYTVTVSPSAICRNSTIYSKVCEQQLGSAIELEPSSHLFSFQIDALAMAAGSLQIHDSDSIGDLSGHFRVPNRPGFVGYVYVWDYTGDYSLPMWCLDKSSSLFHTFTPTQLEDPDVCFITDGRNEQRYYLPIMTQFYVDRGRCSEDGNCAFALCECPAAMGHPDCNRNQHTVALFYANSIQSIVALGLKLQHFYHLDPLNYDMHILRAIAPVLGYTLNVQQSPATASTPIKSWYDHKSNKYIKNTWARGKSYRELLSEAWANLCDTNDCGVIAFQVQGQEEWPITNSMTSFGALRSNTSSSMACQSYVPGPEVFSKLGATPPTPLSNDYFECRKTLTSAFISSIGSAIASANFFSALTWILSGYVIIYLARRRLKQSIGHDKKILASFRTKATLGEAYDAAKQESLLAVLQGVMSSLQDARLEIHDLRDKLGERDSNNSKNAETNGKDTLDAAFEQFQRLHRKQQSDDEFALVGQCISRKLLEEVTHHSSVTCKDETEIEKKEEKEKGGDRAAFSSCNDDGGIVTTDQMGVLVVEMTQNPLASRAGDGNRMP